MKRLAFIFAFLMVATEVSAGGLQLHTRGVRPTARAGAFVAGANDLGALWFNPAGLGNLLQGNLTLKTHFLFDVAYVKQSSSYERVDFGNNPQEQVSSSAPGLPIPTLAGAVVLSPKSVLGFGLYAPYAGAGKYDANGPQRYSLVDMSSSLLLIAQVSYAYKLSDRLRVGGSVQNLFTNLVSEVAFSSCPSEIACAPEDPEFDATGQLQQFDWFSPSLAGGIQYDVNDRLVVGASLQLPFRVAGEGAFKVRLPSSGFFDGSTVEGDRASLRLWLPPIFRAGAQYQVTPRVAVEATASVEFWAIHDDIEIEPQDVQITGAPGIGEYELGKMAIPRKFNNSYSVSLGVEAEPVSSMPLTVMGGYGFETAAAPTETLSVMTVDGQKHLLSAGVGYQFGNYKVYGSAAFVKVADRTVSPEEGMAPQQNPIRTDNPLPVYVNWGDYTSSWIVAGAGVSGAF
jgi:long-chain fatty acid transport protein